jgi:hypothetical protein
VAVAFVSLVVDFFTNLKSRMSGMARTSRRGTLLSPDDALEILLRVNSTDRPSLDEEPDCFSPGLDVDESVSECRDACSVAAGLFLPISEPISTLLCAI